ncbi:hypothetical protein OFN09_01495 [Escherichia coli]|nr:hypothetical protein [Escherichia coli]MCE0562803.1 hypothetical protein [Escherichia coli]MCQ1673280.1 hypothetical protein [Escherichia coli]MCV5598825.1 hypothetical protein [Escherichia coli]
MSVSCREFNAG